MKAPPQAPAEIPGGTVSGSKEPLLLYPCRLSSSADGMENGLCPHSPEEIFHPRFVEALQKQAHVEYLLDVLLFGDTEEIASLITEHGKDVIQLEQRMAELAAADAARTKKHHERHAAAPER